MNPRLFALILATCTLATSDVGAEPKPQPQFQFGNAVEIEDLVLRPNGNILFTTPSPSAEVWEIHPGTANGSAQRVVSLHGTSALGIAQVNPDVYAVSAGNLSTGMKGVEGSFAIHLVDMSQGRAKIKQSIAVPEAKFLSKLSKLGSSGTLLASDSQRGRIYTIDLAAAKTRTLLADVATMNGTTSFPNGVNGIQYSGDHIYYTNSAKGLFCRVGLANGNAAGKSEIVANITDAVPLPDSFAIRSDGHAYIAGSNQVLHVGPGGKFDVAAGSARGKQLAGATSVKFGVGENLRTLFVSTSGHISKPATSSYEEPGKIVSVEV
ncbi:Six-bladed beta-propellerlike protein [Penicillium capsulatum]|uniref:Six-bladed beta-propellerlike protein n=1 Tax=Penicillium capsulatum TaxID=69766 RepID=A0A9W9LLJ8_9EURO|nr:Six-bladed beta-propellerlike protein [Penicillium capsulatum]KAJ6117559.1 Six-bladed beta-propellerlike protein [Penicillium capsulatum]